MRAPPALRPSMASSARSGTTRDNSPSSMSVFTLLSQQGRLHSFTVQLNVSALYGIGGARVGSPRVVWGVARG